MYNYAYIYIYMYWYFIYIYIELYIYTYLFYPILSPDTSHYIWTISNIHIYIYTYIHVIYTHHYIPWYPIGAAWIHRDYGLLDSSQFRHATAVGLKNSSRSSSQKKKLTPPLLRPGMVPVTPSWGALKKCHWLEGGASWNLWGDHITAITDGSW